MSGTILGPEIASPEVTGVTEQASPPDPPEPQVGNKIGPYRLVKLLGEGSSGRVFEVEHTKIGRRAAMKTLAVEHAARPGAIKRLFTEALAVNRINNPHIVEVTDLVENGEHHLMHGGRESLSSLKVNALVMELLEGQSLAQAMVGEGPMPPERFLPILAQVSEAMAAAHAAGFVHRDLKPDNIFLVDRGGQADYVKLLDFGLTKTVNVERELMGSNPALATLDGTFLGTPAYVSPEQASGKSVDHRTDIYALGVILYELVCGHLPFDGQTVGDFIIKHLTVPAPPLPDEIRATKLGRTLDAIIQRCMEKNPAGRFPSAAQLAEIFSALARGETVQFTAMETYLDAWPAGRGAGRRTAFRVVLGLGVGLVLSGVTWALTSGLRRSGGAHPTSEAVAGAAARPSAGQLAETRGADEITLTIESEPPGAEARLAGHDELLGVTPFQHPFPRGSGRLSIELVLRGYEAARLSVPMGASRTINVALTRAQPAPAARRGPGRRPLGTEATIDPFR